MASIKGFKLKNVKQPLGREGYGCIGTMYLGNKKIGEYADYGDGAEADINLCSKENEELLIKIAVEYAKEHPNKEWMAFYDNKDFFERRKESFKKRYPFISEEDITKETVYADISFLVEEFLFLQATEKIFKKNPKRGYSAVGIKGNNIVSYSDSWDEERVLKVAKLDNVEKLFFKLEDFDIK
jgi:hypothetical protein